MHRTVNMDETMVELHSIRASMESARQQVACDENVLVTDRAALRTLEAQYQKALEDARDLHAGIGELLAAPS